jgi:RHS repeat-associated protein
MKRMFIVVLFVSFVSTAFSYYVPEQGRWTSRDPIGEPGFEAIRNKPLGVQTGAPNLYLFVGNQPLSTIDPYGLKIWKCTRTANLLVGRHAYLWDDRPGPRTNRSCGQGGTRRHRNDRTSMPGDIGPIQSSSEPLWDLTFQLFNPDIQCVPLDGTDGREDEIMDHCRDCVNDSGWFPFIVDCHDRCDSVLDDLGITAPPLPRLNPQDLQFFVPPTLNTIW